MSRYRTGVAAAAAIMLAASLAGPARAQVKPAVGDGPDVHRMEIWNGGSRATYYYSQGVSPGEEAALRDLERAENDLAAAGQLLDLRRLYVRNELALEHRRGVVNPLLYGYSSEYAAGLFPGVVTGGYGGFAGLPYGYPYGIGGFGNIGVGFAYPGASAALGSAVNSLSPGLGNEGVIKNELAHTLTDASASEAYARAARAYDVAMARVAGSQRLAAGFKKHNVVPVAEERPAVPVSVTTKDGKTVEGTLVSSDPDWITVETATEEVTLRKSEVTRISRPKKEAKPQ
jgi:hypothetical protein